LQVLIERVKYCHASVVMADSGEHMVLSRDTREDNMQSTYAKDPVKKKFIAILEGEFNGQFAPDRGPLMVGDCEICHVSGSVQGVMMYHLRLSPQTLILRPSQTTSAVDKLPMGCPIIPQHRTINNSRMAKHQAIRESLATLVQRQPLVAVFFGGTTGIGHYTIRALAKAQVDLKGKGFLAYLVRREVNRMTQVIAECNQIYPEGKIAFVQVDDLSLITDVDHACAERFRLGKEEEDPRIDYLMLSQGGPIIIMPRRGIIRVSVWEAK
jgi:hypothetical protein